jgi:hypothetical protein
MISVSVYILSAAKSYRIEYERFKAESEAVPHTGELLPSNSLVFH